MFKMLSQLYNMYQICLTRETLVSQFKESDIVLAKLQQVQWQQNTSLYCWGLQHWLYINKSLQNQLSKVNLNVKKQLVAAVKEGL